jgi:hypothetical protein
MSESIDFSAGCGELQAEHEIFSQEGQKVGRIRILVRWMTNASRVPCVPAGGREVLDCNRLRAKDPNLSPVAGGSAKRQNLRFLSASALLIFL